MLGVQISPAGHPSLSVGPAQTRAAFACGNGIVGAPPDALQLDAVTEGAGARTLFVDCTSAHVFAEGWGNVEITPPEQVLEA